MKHATILAGIALLIATLGASVAESRAGGFGLPGGGNNNGILSGRYVGSTSGLEWFTPNTGDPAKYDFSSSYIGYFDGKGNFFGYATTAAQFTNAAGSLICTYTQTGTYSLKDDDTGTLSVQTNNTSGGCDSIPQVFNIYATQGGSKVCFTQTNTDYTSTTGTTNSIVLSGCYEKQ